MYRCTTLNGTLAVLKLLFYLRMSLQDQLSMRVILHLILTRITSVIRNRSQGKAVILISFCLQLQIIINLFFVLFNDAMR